MTSGANVGRVRIGMLDAYKVEPGQAENFPMLDRYRLIATRFGKVSILTHGAGDWLEEPFFSHEGLEFFLMPDSNGPNDLRKYVRHAGHTLRIIDAFVASVDLVMLRVPHTIAPLLEWRARRQGKRVVPYFKGTWGDGIFDLPLHKRMIYGAFNMPWEAYHFHLLRRYSCYSTGPHLDRAEVKLAMFIENSADESPAVPPAAGIKRILCVGRLTRAKGGDLLVEAIGKLRPDLPVEIIGDGPFRAAMEKRVRELGLEQLRFVGFMAPADVSRLYGPSSLVVIPSRTEGIPKVFLEAVAAGSPLVVPRVGGIPYLAGVEEVAKFFEPGDVEGLAKAINAAMDASSPSGGNVLMRQWALDVDVGRLLMSENVTAPGPRS